MPEVHYFGCVGQIVLIGGGDTMIQAARHARALGLATFAILSPRHAAERLLFASETLAEACRREVDGSALVDDINAWGGFDAIGRGEVRSLALCFGPAWIFSPAVRARFAAGMVNYNPIPVPRYLGGAHYTWQILNGDRSGGCVLQLITDRLDRGPILDRCSFEIADTARTPAHYVEAYHQAGIGQVARFLQGIVKAEPFATTAFDTVDAARLYLPRLHTPSNAFIDWHWTGDEIERFCCAFDSPYIGAGTFADGTEVRLRDVWFEPGEAFHPYLAGLVVRRAAGQFWVAVRGGRLRIGGYYVANGVERSALPKEGDRLLTPVDVLERARGFRARYGGHGLETAGKTAR